MQVTVDETCVEASARIVGAKPVEVATMNSLSCNLHLMMVPFYAPTPARIPHEAARRMDALAEKAVRRGARISRPSTPYGMFAGEDDEGLGIPSMTAGRTAAVARELLVAMNRPGVEGEAVRWTRAEEPNLEQSLSSFAWSGELLAGYGLFLRGGVEKEFSRFLDIMAAPDLRHRQSLVGPGQAEA